MLFPLDFSQLNSDRAAFNRQTDVGQTPEVVQNSSVIAF